MGGEWQRHELKPRLGIPLPGDLPIGRFLVDLRVRDGGSFGVRWAFSKAAAAGEADVIDDDTVQTGFSLVPGGIFMAKSSPLRPFRG